MIKRIFTYSISVLLLTGCASMVIDMTKKSKAESSIRKDGYYIFGNQKIYFYEKEQFISYNIRSKRYYKGGYFVTYHRGEGQICLVYGNNAGGSTAIYYHLTRDNKIPYVFLHTLNKPKLSKVQRKNLPLKVEMKL